MSKWKDFYGNIYKTQDDAYDNALNEILWDDICTYFKNTMTFENFFEAVRTRIPNFYEAFEDEIIDAENNYFNNNYTEIDAD